MIKLIKLEWIKTFSKFRTYISFGAVLLILILTITGLKLDGGRFILENPDFQMLNQNFFLVGNLINGFFVSHLVMFFLMVHIPILIALVAGDLFAGEATAGTLRMILVKPPSRLNIFTAKVFISMIYTTILVLFLAIISLGAGVLLFGTGDLLVFAKGFLILTKTEAILRFLIAYPLAILSMCVVASLAILFSVLVENAIGPIIGTMAVVIVSVIITETPISLFQKISPFLFTYYTKVWQKAFFKPLPFDEILNSVIYLLLFMMLFLGIAFLIFNRKDILS